MAVETANGLILRIGKHPESAREYAKETALLPVLAPTLPVPIPMPRWLDFGSIDFPHGVMGYRRSPASPRLRIGSRLLTSRALRARWQFLRALHAFPVSEAIDLGAGGPLTQDAIEGLRARTMPNLSRMLSAEEFQAVDRWWDNTVSDATLGEYQPAFCLWRSLV